MSFANLTNVEIYIEDVLAPTDPGYYFPTYLQPSYGYVPQAFNPGFPEVRDNVTKRPSQDGTFDFTEFLGARAVTLAVALSPETVDTGLHGNLNEQRLEDNLRKWMHPSRRAWLYMRTGSDETFRRILVRPANVATGFNFITNRNFRTISLSWKAANAVWESGDMFSESIEAGSGSELGRTYDEIYDKTYPASPVVGEKDIWNYGTAPAFPVVKFFGPITQPRLENKTTGKTIEFTTGLIIGAGDYVEVDFAEGTVYLNGDQTNSRYHFLDFAAGISEWWHLIPGANKLRFYPGVYSSPAVALVEWRSAYL